MEEKKGFLGFLDRHIPSLIAIAMAGGSLFYNTLQDSKVTILVLEKQAVLTKERLEVLKDASKDNVKRIKNLEGVSVKLKESVINNSYQIQLLEAKYK